MRTTDTSEEALEKIIVNSLCAEGGYRQGDSRAYDREHAVDLSRLLDFLSDTQPGAFELLALAEDGPKRQQFLGRLQGEITKRGIIDVLRNGVKHGPASVSLYYGTPTPGNTRAEKLFRANIFSVTRQLRYSRDETQLALDMVIFINGLPRAPKKSGMLSGSLLTWRKSPGLPPHAEYDTRGASALYEAV